MSEEKEKKRKNLIKRIGAIFLAATMAVSAGIYKLLGNHKDKIAISDQTVTEQEEKQDEIIENEEGENNQQEQKSWALTEEQKEEMSFTSEENIHTPKELLEQRIVSSKLYDLVFTGNKMVAYKNGSVLNEIEIGEATYGGFSNQGYHYFLKDGVVIKVTYFENKFYAEEIMKNVKRIVNTNYRTSNDNRAPKLEVETIDGKYEVWDSEEYLEGR